MEKRLNGPPAGNSLKVAVSATFIAKPIEDYIKWWCRQFNIEVDICFALYNQVLQELLDENSMISQNTGINLLLVRFEDWLSDAQLSDDEKCIKVEKNLTDLIGILERKPKPVPYFVGIFPVATHIGLSGRMIDYLEYMNQRWGEVLLGLDNVHLVDFRNLAVFYDIEEVFDIIKNREERLPFSDEFFAAMGTAISRQICAWEKQVFKVIVLDCDNTLWKGICGEEGPLGVKVEGPYLELQRLMLQKYKEGMLLALCSKNNEEDVWVVFDKNPQMLLKKEDFVAWKINWKSKSGNIRELATELNLGVDSFIFIGAGLTECIEVMSNCPEVLTLNLPEDSEQIPAFLKHVWAFDRFKVTQEDENRIVLDHIAIAVADIDQTRVIFDLLGFGHGNTVYDPLQKAYLKMCHSSMYDSIEMVAPVNNNSGSYSMLGINNDSPYHLCFKVSDFKKFLYGLEEKNIEYEMISEAKLAVLFNYKEVMFIFVEGVGLVELLQDSEAAIPDKEKYNTIRIVVPEFIEALKFFKYLGYEQEKQAGDSIHRVSSLTLGKHGSGKIELILPQGDISEEAGFIKQNEPYIYQLCFEYMDKDILKLKNAFDSEGQLYDLITGRFNYGSLSDIKEMLVPAKAAYSIVYGKKTPQKNSKGHHWNVNIVNAGGLKHLNYLLPLKNYTGKLLINLSVYENT